MKYYCVFFCKVFELKKNFYFVDIDFFYRLKIKNIKVYENLCFFNYIYVFLMSISLNEKKRNNFNV